MPQGKIADDKVKFAVIMTKDLRRKADVIAQLENRSLSNWIATIVANEVAAYEKEHGEIKGVTPFHFLEEDETNTKQ